MREENKIEINSALITYPEKRVVKKKRERTVYESDFHFVKLWVPHWTQSKVTFAAFDRGFYDGICDAFHQLIYDDSGWRGYVTHKAITFPSNSRDNWSNLKNTVDRKESIRFIKAVVNNAIKSKGMHADMFESNIVIYKDRLSLIDLDGYRSFPFLFNKERDYFEEFDIDAWWKPHESATRDVNKSLKSYMKQVLGTDIDFDLNSEENFLKLKEVIDSLK